MSIEIIIVFNLLKELEKNIVNKDEEIEDEDEQK